MTDEEMRGTMQFILEQQAQFVADMQQMREAQGQQQQQIGRLAEAVLAITGILGKIGDAQEQTERKVARLAEAQTKTDERLGVFVTVVERYISQRGNGKE